MCTAKFAHYFFYFYVDLIFHWQNAGWRWIYTYNPITLTISVQQAVQRLVELVRSRSRGLLLHLISNLRCSRAPGPSPAPAHSIALAPTQYTNPAHIHYPTHSPPHFSFSTYSPTQSPTSAYSPTQCPTPNHYFTHSSGHSLTYLSTPVHSSTHYPTPAHPLTIFPTPRLYSG